MIYYILLLLTLGVIDVIAIVKQKDKKVLIIYILLLIAAMIFGVYYLTHEYEDSILIRIYHLFNIK